MRRERSYRAAGGGFSLPAPKPVLARNIAAASASFSLLAVGQSLWQSLFSIYLYSIGFTAVSIGAVNLFYSASVALASLPAGRVSDAVGRRPPLLAGTALMALAVLLMQLATQPLYVAVLMLAYGAGLALCSVSVMALVAESVEPARVGTAFAAYLVSVTIASALGSAASGFLATALGFQSLFNAAFVASASALVVVHLFVEETLAERRASYREALMRGVSSSISGTASLLKTHGDMAVFALSLAIHSFGFSMVLPFTSLYAQNGAGLTVVEAGLIASLQSAGVLAAQIPAGRMTDRLGARAMFLAHVVLSTFSWSLYGVSRGFPMAAATMTLWGAVGAMDMPARRSLMVEFSDEKNGKGTVIGSLDAISGLTGIPPPLLGGFLWAQLGASAPFLAASAANSLAVAPLLAMRRRARGSAAKTAAK